MNKQKRAVWKEWEALRRLNSCVGETFEMTPAEVRRIAVRAGRLTTAVDTQRALETAQDLVRQLIANLALAHIKHKDAADRLRELAVELEEL